MAWIEVHQSLFTHRKTMELADILGIPTIHAAAHVIALWAWSLDNAPDGALHVRCTLVARACEWLGDANALVDALIESGFLDNDDSGDLRIHDWDDYAGRLIDKRRANAERMRKSRTKQGDSAAPSNKEERATHVQRTLRARAGATVPYSTVPNSTNEEAVASDAPSPSKAKREKERQTAIPDEYTPTDDMVARAKVKHPDMDILVATEAWRNSMKANKSKYRYTDWDQAWWNGMQFAEDHGLHRLKGNGHDNKANGQFSANQQSGPKPLAFPKVARPPRRAG